MSQSRIPMKHKERDMVPRGLVQAMFGLMIAVLALVGWAQWTDAPQLGVVDEAPIVQERVVYLTGDRTGVYSVSDETGRVLAVSDQDKAGFIGVIGLVLNRERTTSGLDMSAPIRVVRRENGNFAILDDLSGLHIELIGYGVDNVAAFARLLDA